MRLMFSDVQNKLPPILEPVAKRNYNQSIGLNAGGRTITWMRSAQAVCMQLFAKVGAVAGSIVGASIGGGAALIERRFEKLKQGFDKGNEVGHNFGLYTGAIVGSIVSSVVVPPFAGLANLFFSFDQPPAPPPSPRDMVAIALLAAGGAVSVAVRHDADGELIMV